MKKHILYASDLDRTLIFSKRFIDESNFKGAYELVETKTNEDGSIEKISYMSPSVKEGIQELNNNDQITFVPVTSRSLEEYNRVKLGFVPEYAIVANGGLILHNGEIVKEWSEYIRKNVSLPRLMQLSMELSEFKSLDPDRMPRLIDGCYLFTKTFHHKKFDEEADAISVAYEDIDFTRQNNKCYLIPKCFSKQVALRWLWNKLNKPYIIASGDSQLDLPMLTLANKAIIPDHGALITEGIVTDARTVSGGVESPLRTIEFIKGFLE